ncbi:hypothetical protein Q5425_37155 [Amycolatopsis sp. A133]|uniref:hypothetical protein n=1 Tax=Amycolatopsis sp. A133 TaxID=3064472 RepID=UPI0027FA4E89|nr:hypothetical protein [Amycolatopsis sp. A133]MDQ7809387.1 hypothetical protein [Amycolatopsis sp. A133]
MLIDPQVADLRKVLLDQESAAYWSAGHDGAGVSFQKGVGVQVMVVAIGVVIVVVAMLCGTKIVIENRRERRRESRENERMRTSAGLPGGSRFAGIDPDGVTIMEIGPSPCRTSNEQDTHGRL